MHPQLLRCPQVLHVVLWLSLGLRTAVMCQSLLPRTPEPWGLACPSILQDARLHAAICSSECRPLVQGESP